MGYAIKRGDTGPPLLAVITDETTGDPVDLTGTTDHVFAIRRPCDPAPVIEVDAAIYNASGQAVGHADRGKFQVTWDEGDTDALFDPTGPDEQHFEGELQMTDAAGKRVTSPTRGWIPFVVWRDVAADGS